MNWFLVSERLPEPCTQVIGFSDQWMHEDYNPNGVRECFLMDDGSWVSAEWNNVHDCYDTDTDTAPTHWAAYPDPPL